MKFENKVYKKSNLEHNDSISTYDGWGAQQNPNSFEVFHNFIENVKPLRILEIGTSLGGFTSFLNYTTKRLNINCEILTYDIHYKNWYEDMIKDGIDVRVENVFNNDYTEINQYVIDFINREGVTVILCDGGNKKEEFKILSNHMKIGDFILGHDYADNKDIFEEKINGKIWNWLELTEDDIKKPCEINNLIDYEKETFNNVVWVCKRKI
jgi:hypothetical protein